LITLYVTPVIYLYLEEFQEKVLNRTSFFHSGHRHHDVPVDPEHVPANLEVAMATVHND
jgi:hypothetical protein